MNTEMQKMEKALNAIADVFTQSYTYRDRQDIEQTANRLGFLQEAMLAALPQQLQGNIEYNEGNPKRLPALRAAVEAELAADKGDEISGRNIAIATARYEELMDQLAFSHAVMAVAKKVYLQRIGKAWTFRVYSKVNQDVVDVSAAREKARRLLGKDVNVDAMHNSRKAG